MEQDQDFWHVIADERAAELVRLRADLHTAEKAYDAMRERCRKLEEALDLIEGEISGIDKEDRTIAERNIMRHIKDVRALSQREGMNT